MLILLARNRRVVKPFAVFTPLQVSTVVSSEITHTTQLIKRNKMLRPYSESLKSNS